MASQAKYSRGTMIDCNSIVIGSYIFAVQSLSRSRMLLILCWWDDESKWAQFGVLSLLPFNSKGKGLFLTIWWWPRSVSVNHVFTGRSCKIHILELLHPLCRVIQLRKSYKGSIGPDPMFLNCQSTSTRNGVATQNELITHVAIWQKMCSLVSSLGILVPSKYKNGQPTYWRMLIINHKFALNKIEVTEKRKVLQPILD